MNVIDELKARNLYSNCTDVESFLDKINRKENVTVYAGFDATASSLHVGNLTTLMMLRIFAKHGCNIIALLGGATTKIGDPSGKDSMRKMLTDEDINKSKESIKKSIISIVPNAKILDNQEWLGGVGYIDFLRDVGALFSVNKMLTMDSVKLRLERQQNLSFLEFNYMILQSFDFWYLYKHYNCNVQIGGSDQWGNITCGIDLIHKKDNSSKAFGITAPLITRADGKKMGKSEDGAIWLNSDMLSDFDYFQYFRNITDDDVRKMLLIFTDIKVSEIDDMFTNNTNINDLKVILAFEATKICRGSDAAELAKSQAEKIFVKNEIDIENAIKIDECGIIDLLINLGVCDSKGDARRLISGNGVKINNKTVSDVNFIVNRQIVSLHNPDFKDSEEYFIFSAGKKKHFSLKF